MKNKYVEIFLSVLLSIVSATVMLLIAEGILRLKNSSMKNYDIEMWRYSKELKKRSDNNILGHEHLRSKCAILQSVEICINNIGLRGKDFIDNEKNKRKILFLGSSITLGWGVEEEKTLTSLIQQKCMEKNIQAEILNAGIGNYNTVRYVERFFTILKNIEPTDIIIQYFVNDAEKLSQGGGNFLLRNFQLAVTSWIFINRYLKKTGESSLLQHYEQVYDKDADGFLAMKKALKKLSDYAKNNNINIFLVMTPDIHNLQDYPFVFIHNNMKTIASDYGYKYLDLLPFLSNIDAKKLWAMPGDPHPNEMGHQIMADAIFPLIFKTK